ncbi:DNA polymerase-3 subunit delta' [Nitrosospira briensis]|uniref:DNA polymerase III subunit delta' n=1 Tax=Nitrosospira briensis TaxID=35799 RepID=A0A1I4YCM6_9PROT|nr:DNA polymerase III subunit delta' [Nitrosospira briensis]SFN35784.1 DNA polymerase-3 subunit delta' [Nitrosospira briensis]
MITIYPWQKEVWRKLALDTRRNARGESTSSAHALLLRGRKGLGKLAFGVFFAKSRLCENISDESDACGICSSCRWFEQGSHPDFRLIEPLALSNPSTISGSERNGSDSDADTEPAAMAEVTDAVAESGSAKSRKKPSKQISVAQIRELADFINVSSHQNGYKIILIHPAEAMNPAAANALLKNLEEPPLKVLFILVTHQAQHLLPTIRSRCRQIAMPAPDPAIATAWLKQQGVKEPEVCLASAGYAPLAAMEFNDDNYLERHGAFIRQISSPGNFNPIALAEEMQKSDLPTVVNWLQKWCYDLMSFRMTGKIRYHPAMLAAIEPLAYKIAPRPLAAYLRTLGETQQLASHPFNPRLFLEELLFSYLRALSLPPRHRE